MHVLFTGGGSAGHVTPNLALIERCQQLGWSIAYAGSPNGIERSIVSQQGISYFAVTSGKLRRQFSLKNLLTPFKVLAGIIQATYLCYRLKPQIVFSKGGFVAFPVVMGAWLNRIPVIVHESDYSPGLSNRLSYPFAQIICLSFSETQRFFSKTNKVKITGSPIRQQLLAGDAQQGKQCCGFSDDKPILLIVGGGLGAERINQQIRELLPTLLTRYNIIHLCGKRKTSTKHQQPGYSQFEYVSEEMADLLACADIVISRAGANSIFELLLLKKPHILIPLAHASRGDQIQNARYYEKKDLSYVIQEDDLSATLLLKTIDDLFNNRERMIKNLEAYPLNNAVDTIIPLLEQLRRKT